MKNLKVDLKSEPKIRSTIREDLSIFFVNFFLKIAMIFQVQNSEIFFFERGNL